jgi:hypothetical protein
MPQKMRGGRDHEGAAIMADFAVRAADELLRFQAAARIGQYPHSLLAPCPYISH